MFNTIRRSILFCLIMVAAAQSVCAEDLERWQIDDKLYDANKAELTGGICWNANVGDAFYYKHENGAEACIALDLKTGESKIRYPHEGYIIQHDGDEYSGALFAVERNGHLTITHEDASGTSEIVYKCDDIQPIEHYGRQTIRAYIRGSLYYLQALEEEQLGSRSTFDEKTGSEIEIEYYLTAPAQLCRMDSDGSAYRYGVTANYEHWTYQPRILDEYAINPNGTVAWVDSDADNIKLQIVVENPALEKLAFISCEEFKKNGYGELLDGSICWISEKELVVGIEEVSLGDNILLCVNIETMEMHPMTTRDGDVIILKYGPRLGSGMHVSPDGRYIAYFAWSNWLEYLAGTSVVEYNENYDVPVILDLYTGITYRVYEYDNSNRSVTDQINRATRGQLSWYK